MSLLFSNLLYGFDIRAFDFEEGWKTTDGSVQVRFSGPNTLEIKGSVSMEGQESSQPDIVTDINISSTYNLFDESEWDNMVEADKNHSKSPFAGLGVD